jgi:hypothetical protein
LCQRRPHAAIADETEHTRLAFGLASAYAGRHIGPDALPIDGALDAADLPAILETVIREGCIGETVAAVEAAEALAHATDPAVRQVLERIAQDETNHAELAWRFVRWVATHHAAGRDLAAVAFQSALTVERQRPRATRATRGDARLLAHGVVSDALHTEIRARVLAEVVEPGAQTLLSATARQAA